MPLVDVVERHANLRRVRVRVRVRVRFGRWSRHMPRTGHVVAHAVHMPAPHRKRWSAQAVASCCQGGAGALRPGSTRAQSREPRSPSSWRAA
eukprot:scaffold58492_cov59-Phaeocystis_antarctica.AAC.2